VVAKEEPSSKRGHGDACASAGPGGAVDGDARSSPSAALAREAARQPLGSAVAVWLWAFGTGQTEYYCTVYRPMNSS
jgi:hypothetical protein